MCAASLTYRVFSPGVASQSVLILSGADSWDFRSSSNGTGDYAAEWELPEPVSFASQHSELGPWITS